ncbi:hypothetical protein NPIL_541891, partial [Nephila pilipes]
LYFVQLRIAAKRIEDDAEYLRPMFSYEAGFGIFSHSKSYNGCMKNLVIEYRRLQGTPQKLMYGAE